MQRRLPPLESLRVFEACARHSNFSHAAAELGVTPTAVSLRVRDLERRLGLQLFDRHGPRVTPSAAGLALARRLATSFADIRSAIEEAAALAPVIQVTVVSTVASMWLTPRLKYYQARPGASEVKLTISSALPADGKFDVAILSGSGDWPDLSATLLIPAVATPMLSPALAARVRLDGPGDLARLPQIIDEAWPRWFLAAGLQQPPPVTRWGVDYPTQDLVAQAALAGDGVAMLSPTLFAPMLADGRLVQPFPQIVRGPGGYSALVAEDERRPAVLDFVAWLAVEAGQGADPA